MPTQGEESSSTPTVPGRALGERPWSQDLFTCVRRTTTEPEATSGRQSPAIELPVHRQRKSHQAPPPPTAHVTPANAPQQKPRRTSDWPPRPEPVRDKRLSPVTVLAHHHGGLRDRGCASSTACTRPLDRKPRISPCSSHVPRTPHASDVQACQVPSAVHPLSRTNGRPQTAPRSEPRVRDARATAPRDVNSPHPTAPGDKDSSSTYSCTLPTGHRTGPRLRAVDRTSRPSRRLGRP